MKAGLTKRQSEVLAAIELFIERNGYSPSYEEIGGAVGLRSLATVHGHVQQLKLRKYISLMRNKSRTIAIR